MTMRTKAQQSVAFLIVAAGVVLLSLSPSSSGTLALTDDTFCNQIVPGVPNMVMGVDLTRLSIYPLSEDGDHGMRRKVIELTCALGHKWHHPSLEKEFDWPDQVSEIVPRPTGQVSQSFSLDSDTQKLKHDWSVKVSMEANVPFGSFSASTSYKHAQERIVSSNQSVSEMSAIVSSVQVDLVKAKFLAPALDPGFKDALEELANKSGPFASDPEPYNQVITQYGTHYWERVSLGGYLQVNAYLTNSYVSETSEQEVEANMKVSVMTYFGLSVDGSDSRTEVSEQFRQNSQMEARYYGGDKVPTGPSSSSSRRLVKSNHLRRPLVRSEKANPATRSLSDDNSDFMNEWVPTVNANPWLASGALVPLTELIVSNQTLKKELELATRWYLMTAYLDELRTAYSYGRVDLTSQPLYNELMELVDGRKVDQLEEIGQKIGQLLFVLEVWTNQKTLVLSELNWLRTPFAFKGYTAEQCLKQNGKNGTLFAELEEQVTAVGSIVAIGSPIPDSTTVTAINTTLTTATTYFEDHRNLQVDQCPRDTEASLLLLCKLCFVGAPSYLPIFIEGDEFMEAEFDKLSTQALTLLDQYCKDLPFHFSQCQLVAKVLAGRS